MSTATQPAAPAINPAAAASDWVGTLLALPVAAAMRSARAWSLREPCGSTTQ
ncbi:hypothetical protein D3C83_308840 [compost metagenome]